MGRPNPPCDIPSTPAEALAYIKWCADHTTLGVYSDAHKRWMAIYELLSTPSLTGNVHKDAELATGHYLDALAALLDVIPRSEGEPDLELRRRILAELDKVNKPRPFAIGEVVYTKIRAIGCRAPEVISGTIVYMEQQITKSGIHAYATIELSKHSAIRVSLDHISRSAEDAQGLVEWAVI